MVVIEYISGKTAHDHERRVHSATLDDSRYTPHSVDWHQSGILASREGGSIMKDHDAYRLDG